MEQDEWRTVEVEVNEASVHLESLCNRRCALLVRRIRYKESNNNIIY